MIRLLQKIATSASCLRNWASLFVILSVFLFSIASVTAPVGAEETSHQTTSHHLTETNVKGMNVKGMDILKINHASDHNMHGMECMTFQCHAMALFDFSYSYQSAMEKNIYLSVSTDLISAELESLKRPPRQV